MMTPDEPPEDIDDAESPSTEDEESDAYRGASSDPTFGYLIALALALGLMALPAGNEDFRYTLSWLALTTFGVLSWLFGSGARIGQEQPENLAWGIVFAVLIATPLLAFGGNVLSSAVRMLFPRMSAGTLLAYLVFVMPVGETLFFRGVLQQSRPWWIVGLFSSAWSLVLFFPVMWDDLIQSPAVGIIIGTALVMVNVIYSYVRHRNGMAAAWICQIVMNIILVFIPSV